MKLKSLLTESANDIFKILNGLQYRHINISGGPKTKKALELLTKKHGPEYASGVYHGAVKFSYDFKYSGNAYDEKYGNTTQEFEKDVLDLQKILKAERLMGESKKIKSI